MCYTHKGFDFSDRLKTPQTTLAFMIFHARYKQYFNYCINCCNAIRIKVL